MAASEAIEVVAVSRPIEIRGGTVVTPAKTVREGRVVLRGDRIDRVDPLPAPPVPGCRQIDATDRIVMPGLVDLHGDDVEGQLFPREGARVDPATAVTNADRFNVANGVTTKFHAIAFEDAPSEDRSIETARELANAITETDRLLGDNRVHARCELEPESVASVAELIHERPVGLVSIMHHTPTNGQFDSVEAFERLYVGERDCSASEAKRLARRRLEMADSRLTELGTFVGEIAREAGLPVASHDDDSADAVTQMADCHATISEYPVALDAARRARELGMTTAMGAPNLVRGGSLWGNLDVETGIEHGVVDVLCSDYHPPSLLEAPFVDTGESLATRVARVTATPADAVGLSDRGRLVEGARADVLVVDPEPHPVVDRAFVGGESAYATGTAAEPAAHDDLQPEAR